MAYKIIMFFNMVSKLIKISIKAPYFLITMDLILTIIYIIDIIV